MRKTSYSDLGLGDDEIQDMEGDDDEGGVTTADDSHSDYDTDPRKKGGAGSSAGDLFGSQGDDVARVSDVDLFTKTQGQPAQQQQLYQMKESEGQMKKRDQEPELLLKSRERGGSSSSGVTHYESISSSKDLPDSIQTEPSSSSKQKDQHNHQRNKKNKTSTTANLRRAFFSEFSPRPETVEEEEQESDDQEDLEERVNGKNDGRKVRKIKSKERSLEAEIRGGDPNVTEFDASTGSPSKMSLLGLRSTGKGFQGGIRAVFFSRNRTKSLDVSAGMSDFSPATSLKPKNKKQRRVSSAAQVQQQSLSEEGSSLWEKRQEQGFTETELKEQDYPPSKQSSLPLTSSSLPPEERSHDHSTPTSSSSPAASLEKYPRRRSSGGGSSSKALSSKVIPVKPPVVPSSTASSSSVTVVHIESDV